jgi:hypothetical protein
MQQYTYPSSNLSVVQPCAVPQAQLQHQYPAPSTNPTSPSPYQVSWHSKSTHPRYSSAEHTQNLIFCTEGTIGSPAFSNLLTSIRKNVDSKQFTCDIPNFAEIGKFEILCFEFGGFELGAGFTNCAADRVGVVLGHFG